MELQSDLQGFPMINNEIGTMDLLLEDVDTNHTLNYIVFQTILHSNRSLERCCLKAAYSKGVWKNPTICELNLFSMADW